MEEKRTHMTLLFDLYGDILTEKQREVFDLYYNEDLSLTEIAEHTGITRQGVRDSVQRAAHTLEGLEAALGLQQKQQAKQQTQSALLAELSGLEALASNDAPAQMRAGLRKLRQLIEAL